MAKKTLIPANPGFFEVHCDGAVYFVGDPIIAWSITQFLGGLEVEAITPAGFAQGCGYLRPNGSVEAHETTYPNLEDANDALKG